MVKSTLDHPQLSAKLQREWCSVRNPENWIPLICVWFRPIPIIYFHFMICRDALLNSLSEQKSSHRTCREIITHYLWAYYFISDMSQDELHPKLSLGLFCTGRKTFSYKLCRKEEGHGLSGYNQPERTVMKEELVRQHFSSSNYNFLDPNMN